MYRPGEWEQLPSERDLNPFSRYEALNPKRPIVLDDFGTGKGLRVKGNRHHRRGDCFHRSFCVCVCVMRAGNTEAEQAEKSPSDEGFTELEPTVNGSTEEAEGSTLTLKDHPLGPGQCDDETSKLDSYKGKLDDDEDEGLAQNSSIEDGESMQSASESEKRGDQPARREPAESRDAETKGTAERLGDAALEDPDRQLSPTQGSEVHGTSNLKRQSPDTPTSGSPGRRRKSYEAEMKSWLLERMQAPIEGERSTSSPSGWTRASGR